MDCLLNITSTSINNNANNCFNEISRCFWSLTNMYDYNIDADKNGYFSIFNAWDLENNRFFYVYEFGESWRTSNAIILVPQEFPEYSYDLSSYKMLTD